RGIQRLDAAEGHWETFPNPGVSDAVDAIVQDGDRRIWAMKTQDFAGKLAHYDGLAWHEVDREHGPPPLRENVINTVSRVIEGPEDKPWFLAGNEFFSTGGDGRWRLDLDLRPLLSTNRLREVAAVLRVSDLVWATDGISLVAVDQEGEVRRTTPFGGTAAGNAHGLGSLGLEGLPDTAMPRRIFEGRDGRLWFFGAGFYIWRYDPVKDQWLTFNIEEHLAQQEVRRYPIGSPLHLIMTSVCGIGEDKLGRIMAATHFGLVVSDQNADVWQTLTPQNSNLPSAEIDSILTDRQGRIWLGTQSGIALIADY
ncbi:MAG TPA: two-component regulator propeller domain-containing protein, partial [Blastocatellia bacterium]